jgi:peptidoglycan/xylan/chitin deacetylase (PgdA/CDA1 family)
MAKVSNIARLAILLVGLWTSSAGGAENPNQQPSADPQVLNSIKTHQPIIALTFDDGPHPIHTKQLLDMLREEQTPATFFVVGRNVQSHPELVRRMVQEGHEVGNHTWSHPSLPSLSSTKVDDELSRTSDIIQQLTGIRPQTMRPPYGAMNQRVQRQILDKHGMHIILWSVDPKDWKKPNVNTIRQRMVAGASPGGIILAHDIHPGTIQAIPYVIRDLKVLGYKFVTIQELLAANTPAYRY